MAPADEQFPAGVGEAVARYEQFQKMFVHQTTTAPDINQLREERNQGATHYGWENFGDLAWSGGVFSALHYDWPYSMWLQFMRSGDGAFFSMAHQMTEHSADLDQIHCTNSALHDGLWQWEQVGSYGGHHKSLHHSGSWATHTWNGGYALGYLLTGNRRYLEATERGVMAARRLYGKVLKGSTLVQNMTRSQGWCILMLVNLYKITGDQRLLVDALAIFNNSLLFTEQLATIPGSGGKGYIMEKDGKVYVTFAAYPLEPLCDLHYEAGKAGLDTRSLEAYLVRNLKWLKEYAFVGGKSRLDGMYSYLTISYATDPLDPSKNMGGTLAHNILFAGAFGYGSIMLKESNPQLSREFLFFGRHLFRDLMLYRQTGAKQDKNSYNNPKNLSRIYWGWLPTATKELGYIGRGGQQYLWAEKMYLGK